jgi:hypothetical protein
MKIFSNFKLNIYFSLQLIFVKEYTCAEGKAFHVKHFCCYECDMPLGGKQYIPKDNQPLCLECFQNKYGKVRDSCYNVVLAKQLKIVVICVITFTHIHNLPVSEDIWPFMFTSNLSYL